jgi:phosphonate transport system substrate-binding protein
MSYMFTVSPDFGPEHLSGWYIFNTWLQKQTGLPIHLETYECFIRQRAAVQDNQIDLIYANAYDTSMLVREKGFAPLAKIRGESDEALIAVLSDRPIQDICELPSPLKLSLTSDPDVRMMGMMMLEPADLQQEQIELLQAESYVLVAKNLLRDQADAGIFLAKAYDGLSSMIKKQLRVLVRSEISVIHHALMIGPRMAEYSTVIQDALLHMHECEKGQGVLNSMGFQRWQAVDREQMEFMIDLMDTLDS